MNNAKLAKLQESYPELEISSIKTVHKDCNTELLFNYKLANIDFQTTYELPNTRLDDSIITDKLLKYLAIVESFSYWKLACSPSISLKNISLSDAEKFFFEKLLRFGMGEFLYRNQIPLDIKFEFKTEDSTAHNSINEITKNLKGSLVLIGGGKDSVVSLELLKKLPDTSELLPLVPFALNPIEASIDCIKQSGLEPVLLVIRKIDPKLAVLNTTGEYFNGHIPFSAVLTFISALVSYANGYKNIITSNESSANQGNLRELNIKVNHQYSKSFEYEKDLRNLFKTEDIPLNYFSLLRPFNEVQITKLFSEFNDYHLLFQSCNIKQTAAAKKEREYKLQLEQSDKWCGKCPKCVFVWLMLGMFLPKKELIKIFSFDIELNEEFKDIVRQLIGDSLNKPFECVGTFEEVSLAVSILEGIQNIESAKSFLSEWNQDNYLSHELDLLLKEKISGFC